LKKAANLNPAITSDFSKATLTDIRRVQRMRQFFQACQSATTISGNPQLDYVIITKATREKIDIVILGSLKCSCATQQHPALRKANRPS
jgi:hypothetical protein